MFGQTVPAPEDRVHMSLWRQVTPTMTFCGRYKPTWQHLTEISHWLVDTTVRI